MVHKTEMKMRRVISFISYSFFALILLLLPAFVLAATTVGSNITTGGSVYVTTTLMVDGNTTLGNAASDTVTVNADVASNLLPNNNNGRDLGAYGSAWSEIFASGTAYIATLSVDGNTTLGNATSDTLTVTARLAADLDPNANNTIDLGAYDLAYNDLFASGTVYTAILTVDGNTTLGNANTDTVTFTADVASNILPNANNTRDLGEYGSAWRTVYASTSLLVGDAGALVTLDTNSLTAATSFEIDTTANDIVLDPGGNNVNPGSNNADDLGAYGTAWKDVFASGTVYADDVNVAGTLTLNNSGGLNITNVSSTNVSATGYLDVDGATTLDGAVTLGDATGDDITITGRIAADIDPKTHNTYDLGANGLAWNDIFASGSIYAGDLYVDGNLSLDNAQLTVTNVSSTNVSATGYLDVDGATTLDGAVTLGDATGDDITITGYIASHLLAKTVDTYDLGSYAQAWRNIYASGTLYLGDEVNVAGITDHLSLQLNNVTLASAATSTFKCVTSTAQTVTGAALGNTVLVSPLQDDQAWDVGTLTAFIPVADTVVLKYCTGGGQGDADPADTNDYRVDVWKH